MFRSDFFATSLFCRSFGLVIFVLAMVTDGQELPESFYPCRWDYTCAEIEEFSAITGRVMNGGRCFCDDQCTLHGDCCDRGNSSSDPDVQCVPIPFYQNKYVGAYGRTVCSNGSPCDVDPDDIFSMLPVFNRDGFGYRNAFCALCNGENHAVFGNVTMKCREGFRLNKTITNPLSLFTQPDSFIWNFCRLSFDLPSHIKCIAAVDSCPADSNPTFNDQCRSYMRTIFDKETLYKNIYCAACNGVDLTSLTGTDCTSPLIKGPQQLLVEEASNFTSKGIFQTDWKVGYSMTILLDMNLQDGNVVGLQRKCQEGMVFDPWNAVCRKVVCPQGLTYQDGNCRAGRDAGPWDPDWNDSSNDSIASHITGAPDCPRIEFDLGQYALVDNTIYLNASGKSYNLSQVHFNGSTAGICKGEEYQDSIGSYSDAERILSFICLALSLCCLLIHFAVYILAGKFRLVPDLNMLSISSSIFMAQVFFLLAPLAQYLNASLCITTGILLHFFWLSSFTWSSVIAYDITKTILSLEHPSFSTVTYSSYLRFSLYAWLTPCIPVIIGIILDALVPTNEFSPVYGQEMCWVGRRKSLLVLFGAPVASIILGNLVFYIITANALWRSHKNRQTLKTASAKSAASDARFGLYLKLAMIMGVAWVTGLFSSLALPLRYVSFITNGLQGVYIFAAFSCKKSMFVAARKKRDGFRNVVERLSSLGSRKSGSSTTTSIVSLDKNFVTKSVSGGPGIVITGKTHYAP